MFRGMEASSQETCYVIEINREPTPLSRDVSDFLIKGSAGEILSCIIERIKEKRK
jgi:hypothetical protein